MFVNRQLFQNILEAQGTESFVLALAPALSFIQPLILAHTANIWIKKFKWSL